MTTIAKGTIVTLDEGEHGIVLALTKDGQRAKVYVYGPDAERWLPVAALAVERHGPEQCWKCGGSGLFYFGGAVVNGVYQGRTGPCFGCQGKGTATAADRTRCHYYWHRTGDEDKRPV